jgi:hypothetical protein
VQGVRLIGAHESRIPRSLGSIEYASSCGNRRRSGADAILAGVRFAADQRIVLRTVPHASGRDNRQTRHKRPGIAGKHQQHQPPETGCRFPLTELHLLASHMNPSSRASEALVGTSLAR